MPRGIGPVAVQPGVAETAVFIQLRVVEQPGELVRVELQQLPQHFFVCQLCPHQLNVHTRLQPFDGQRRSATVIRCVIGFGVATQAVAVMVVCVTSSVEPLVETDAGTVRGCWQDGVHAFRGIPYGDATAAGRFLPAVPARSWAGVRDATSFGHYCPQPVAAPQWCDPRYGAYMTGGRAQELIDAQIVAGEDCLVLNVLTPRAAETGRGRPVLVYIHGGGYHSMCGSIPTLADGFVREQDVVLVTVNHRLNAFGFLYLGDFSEQYATGNVGLLDLELALRWVRTNIALFGGDPDNVTVFGESGGGSKILNLMAMDTASGLFHRAIVQSSSWPESLPRQEATVIAEEFLRRVGVGSDLSGLNEISTQAIVDAVAAIGRRFRPVLDGQTITSPPWNTAAPPTAQHVSLIVGNCQHECSGFIADPLFRLRWPDLIPQLAKHTSLPPTLLEPVVDVYRASRPSDSPSDIFVAVFSDRLREIGLRVAEQQCAQQDNVYVYNTTYQPPMDNDPNLGAFHGLESPLALRLVLHPDAEAVSRQITDARVSFARTGNPNHAGIPAWPTYHKDRATMVFDREPHLVYDPSPAERKAMSGLPHLGAPAPS